MWDCFVFLRIGMVVACFHNVVMLLEIHYYYLVFIWIGVIFTNVSSMKGISMFLVSKGIFLDELNFYDYFVFPRFCNVEGLLCDFHYNCRSLHYFCKFLLYCLVYVLHITCILVFLCKLLSHVHIFGSCGTFWHLVYIFPTFAIIYPTYFRWWFWIV